MVLSYREPDSGVWRQRKAFKHGRRTAWVSSHGNLDLFVLRFDRIEGGVCDLWIRQQCQLDDGVLRMRSFDEDLLTLRGTGLFSVLCRMPFTEFSKPDYERGLKVVHDLRFALDALWVQGEPGGVGAGAALQGRVCQMVPFRITVFRKRRPGRYSLHLHSR